MSAWEIYRKTFPFVMAKLCLGLVLALISVVILAITLGIGFLFGGLGILIGLALGISGVKIASFIVMHYFGYLIKAGHVAVVAETLVTGEVPDNQVSYGKNMVQEKFAESNVYFVVDKLVSAAVRQIQATVSKAGGYLDFVPGMQYITSAANMFIGISLNYIDECCLGYTFYMQDQGAFKSAADGVVIYAQSWKSILKGAALTALKVILLTAGLTVAFLVPIGIIGTMLKVNTFILLIIAFVLAMALKDALVDSYMMIAMMTVYMEAATTTEVQFDLYGKLCKMSKSFKELFDKGEQEEQLGETQGAYDAQ